jgi:RNA polymerase sigma-70 factor (ECF subfamily)
MTDEELSAKIRQKDKSAFTILMERYNRLLWVVVGGVLEKAGTAEDIEDCVSEVYLKLLENPKIYDPKKGGLKSFLVKIGRNLAIDRYRKLTRLEFSDFDAHTDLQDESDLLQFVIDGEDKRQIMDALDHMKEPDREIFVRRYFLNEKVKTISDKMLLQPKFVENRLYQGKMAMKRRLTDWSAIYEQN